MEVETTLYGLKNENVIFHRPFLRMLLIRDWNRPFFTSHPRSLARVETEMRNW